MESTRRNRIRVEKLEQQVGMDVSRSLNRPPPFPVEHFCRPLPPRIKRVTIPTILLSKHLRRSRLPLDYTYTSLKILKLSRCSAFIENRLELPGVRPVLHPFQCQAERRTRRRRRCVDLEKRRKSGERKKNKANSFSPTSRPNARDCPCLSARKTYSFDHPIPSFSPSPLLPHRDFSDVETRRFHTGGKRGGEEKGNKTRVSLSPPPSYLSDVLTGGIKRSHETGKPQSANTPWGRHEYRRIGNRLALGIRRQLAATGLPVFFRYLSPRLESNGNPRQTSCEESGINLLPPSSYIPLSISSLHRGTTTLRSAIFAFLDLVVIVRIGSDKESGFLFARRRGRRSTSSAVPAG